MGGRNCADLLSETALKSKYIAPFYDSLSFPFLFPKKKYVENPRVPHRQGIGERKPSRWKFIERLMFCVKCGS